MGCFDHTVVVYMVEHVLTLVNSVVHKGVHVCFTGMTNEAM